MSNRAPWLTRGQLQRRISRRRLIGSTAGLLVAGYVASGVSPGPASAEAASFDTLSELTRAHFASLLGHAFQIQSPEGQVVIAVLRQVRVPRPRVRAKQVAAGQPALETFTLIFASHDVALPQDTYSVQHPTLGRFALFLVPAAYAGARSAYAATFNRLVA